MGLPEGAFSKKTSETGDSAVSASGSTVAAKLAGVKEPTNGKRIPKTFGKSQKRTGRRRGRNCQHGKISTRETGFFGQRKNGI